MLILCADMFLALDKDMNGTLSKQELREYADGTLTEIFIERGREATPVSPFKFFYFFYFLKISLCPSLVGLLKMATSLLNYLIDRQ